MDGSIIGALLGIAGLTMVNITVIAYTYGRMCQKVDDVCKRVDRLERRIFNGGNKHG